MVQERRAHTVFIKYKVRARRASAPDEVRGASLITSDRRPTDVPAMTRRGASAGCPKCAARA
eukprot:337148-Prymnesium_polylepis.1